MKKIALSFLLLVFALYSQAQISPSDKIYEILNVFKYVQKYDFSYLGSKGYNMAKSKTDQINKHDIGDYGWVNAITKNGYLLKFEKKQIIGVYFSTFNTAEYNSILKDAQTMGYKPFVNKTMGDDMDKNSRIFKKGDMAMAFSTSVQGNLPFYMVKIVQLSVWDKINN